MCIIKSRSWSSFSKWEILAEGVCRESIGDKARKTPKLGIVQYPERWSLIHIHEMINRWELNWVLS